MSTSIRDELNIPPPLATKRISLRQHLMNILGILQLLFALAFNPLQIVFKDGTMFTLDWNLNLTGDYGSNSITLRHALEVGSQVDLSSFAPYDAFMNPRVFIIFIVGLNLLSYFFSIIIRWLPLARLRRIAKLIQLSSLIFLFLIFYAYYFALKTFGLLGILSIDSINILPTILGSFGLLFLLTGNSSGTALG